MTKYIQTTYYSFKLVNPSKMDDEIVRKIVCVFTIKCA